ncbi:unknown [Candidatus Colimorpha enterica]|uniref:Uncharacterized protein n=1 Tax=Candidatus Colimorpha enterica TaxID=3083063 RepID=R6V013_9BACT|nr:unknown [Candidatus Colimorpha enterica]
MPAAANIWDKMTDFRYPSLSAYRAAIRSTRSCTAKLNPDRNVIFVSEMSNVRLKVMKRSGARFATMA